ncbi:expressed unknown protein [Seminavis robusta]|uniref:Uncharacterized protein n=1 Tax=Seminavis robusta TaxID=568900 RepID=A0A9N8HRI5_9STRA|nr:expressed unknown protein [Seminavis robusta]|eukprot:Sro1401_g269490.1 n/a (179) ;mRNA; r:21968-22646
MLAPQQQPQPSTTSGNNSPSGVADRRYHIAMSYQGKPSDLPTMPDAVKSQSIPISGVHRTASEVQLCEDEALADYRDFVVYSRIVNGISRQQDQRPSRDLYLRQENDRCLSHIMSTRNGKNEEAVSSSKDRRTPLQCLSQHIAQGMVDDYFCGEDPPSNGPAGYFNEEEEDDIFSLEL